MKDIMYLENGKMPVSTPEEQGISSRSITSFMDAIRREDLALHSFQIVRNGKLVASTVARPYSFDSFHRIFSAAKGVVATGMLFAIQEGYYGLDEPVLPRLPKEWIPEDLDERWNRLTVYHLLTMNTGHDHDTLFKMWGLSDCWIKTFLTEKPAYEPGAYFCYDMGAQYVMNELVRLATGLDMGAFLKPRVFDPLGIEYTNQWTEPERHFFSSTICFKPDALTKFAQFYLQEGNWEGKQLLDPELARMAGERHCPSFHYDPQHPAAGRVAGYCMHMWRNSVGGFQFNGGQGQYAIVIPDENMAVGIMCGEHNAARVTDLFFECIYGDMYRRPIPVDEFESRKLQRYLRDFNLAPERVSPRSDIGEAISGRVFKFQPNRFGQQSISFDFTGDVVKIHTVADTGEADALCGLGGEWARCRGYMLMKRSPDEVEDLDRIFGYDTHDVMYSGGWSDRNAFKFYLRSDSLLCDYRFECRFEDDDIELLMSFNTEKPRNSARGGRPADIVLRGSAI